MKIHLVDGTYELFRAHFGAPPKKAFDGMEVGATLGLVRSMMLLLSDPEVTHVAVAFDHVIESFRNKLYAGYKTGEGVDPNLMAQFPLAEKAVSALVKLAAGGAGSASQMQQALARIEAEDDSWANVAASTFSTHPMVVRRIEELRKFAASAEYRRLSV